MKINNQDKGCENINNILDIVKKAVEGDAVSQLNLGAVYLNSIYVRDNCETAFDWILRSAEQGNMEAQFRLGDLYALGHGTPRRFSDAFEWYTKAAIQGYKKARLRIHNLYQQDIRMHCRGQINSEEDEWASEKFKADNHIRELNEYRLIQTSAILNGAIDYYTSQFKHYQSSDQRDLDAQLNLAFLYQHGYGVKKCIRWAFEYYTMAAKQRNVDAQYNLGDLYNQNKKMKFNTRQAFEWFTKAAKGGHIAAQRSLAYFYYKGLATDIDYDAAVLWYTKAAEAGDSEAQVILGKLYRKGECFEMNMAQAAKWYSLAARQGNRVAQNCLTQLHQRGILDSNELEDDISKYSTENSIINRLCSKLSKDLAALGDSCKFKQLNKIGKRALMGDTHAMYEIGLQYYETDKEFIQDRDTGIKWIKNAANAKHKDAQLMIAGLYKNGDSVKQDYRKAYIWYKTVSKKKDSNAQLNVGIMYNEGLGVRKDPLEAIKWFTWAEEGGNSSGQYYLSNLKFDGRGLREDKEEALDLLYKSAGQKNALACCALSTIFCLGKFGINENTKRGKKLLDFAARNGSVEAQIEMARMYQEGRGIQQDIQKCIEYYTMAAVLGSAEAQYHLAMVYLNQRGVKHDYVKAYNLIQQAKKKGYETAKILFQTPVKFDFSVKDYSKIIDMFMDVTEKGLGDFSYNVGSIYEFGVTYNRTRSTFLNDYTKAKKMYLIASNNGDTRADYRLGVMHDEGKGVGKCLETAIHYYNKASMNGNADASYKLAYYYFNGDGVAQDLLKAFHYYTVASTLGHKEATKVLKSFENYKKNGVDSNHLLKQVSMLEIATEEGYTRLQYEIGIMFENNNDNSKAIRWLGLAAEIGITDAYYRLGILYAEGRGVEQDYSRAETMYQKATEKGHEDACYRLAQLYHYGNGVKLDYLKAYHFYKKAAEMDHVEAFKTLNITLLAKFDLIESCFDPSSKEYHDSLLMCKYVAEHGNTDIQFKVGFAYEHIYLEPNYDEAFKWYSIAARSSHREAIYHLGLLYEKGLRVTQDHQIAIHHYFQASQLGSDDADYQLGVSFHHGKGVDVNSVKALEYYKRSVKFGNPIYKCELGRLYEKGELVDKNLLEAIKWYTHAYLSGYDGIRGKLHDMYQDNPYESFFYKKLVEILSLASHGKFRLNLDYYYEDFGYINNRLGSLHLLGQGTTKDSEKALIYFSKEYTFSLDGISNCLLFLKDNSLSPSQKNDILKAIVDDEVFLDQIDVEQLYILGVIFFDGIIQTESLDVDNFGFKYISINTLDQGYSDEYIQVEMDYSRAFKCLERAANENHYWAMLQLGVMYHCGHGVEQDNDQGENYFNHAIDGNVESTEFMECIVTLYHTHEVMQNFVKAFEWYKRLEKKLDEPIDGFTHGKITEQTQLGLALLFEYGDGVEQDYQKALEHYRNLASSNIKIGIHRLGLLYYYGKGTSVDYRESFILFERASLDNPWWGDKLVFVYDQNDSHGTPSQSHLVYSTLDKNEVDGESHYYLGMMYKNGQGVSQDETKAQHHFRVALDCGCKRAKYKIED